MRISDLTAARDARGLVALGTFVVTLTAALAAVPAPPAPPEQAAPAVAPSVPSAPAAAPAVAAPTFLGQDRFDEIRDLATLRDLEHDVRQVAERVRPAVVLLRMTGGGAATAGTGVIISPDGLIATCGHVGVRPGRPVQAVLSDGTTISGHTLGQVFEGDVDCGLVQLDAGERTLPSVPLGTTVGLAKGDWLLAMGFTHGPSEEPRAALVRVGRVLRNSRDQLLFDAPIDAGDSGGPSFNLRGEVVGLNSRCGRQPWENLATPVDLLRDRQVDLRAQTASAPGGRAKTGEATRGTNFPSGGSDSGKLAVQRLTRLTPVVEEAQKSLLRVLVNGDTVAYGTVVDRRGFALTKGSQISGDAGLEVETPDRHRYTATVAARDSASDVALLKIEGALPDELVEIAWDSDEHVAPGMALVTPRIRPDAAALGFAAIEVRESERDWTSAPYLGVRTSPATKADLTRVHADSGVLVEEVVAGAPAERAGLVPGDVLVSLDGKPMRGRDGLRRLIIGRSVGDRVTLEVASTDGTRTVEATLALRGAGNGRIQRGNTTTAISRVSSGLGHVLPHDTILTPEQMGGPVVDLDGHAVGLNIARYDRTATHAIPASRVTEVVRALKEQARPAPGSAVPSAAP